MTTALEVLDQNRDPNCTLCTVSEDNPHTVCMQPSVHREGEEGGPALLVIGEAPGHWEDLAGEPFVGQSGKILKECYLTTPEPPPEYTIYLTNAVRCHPLADRTPTPKERNICRPYLYKDMAAISNAHSELTILCTGTTASQTLCRVGITKAMGQQGMTLPLKDAPDAVVYFTSHPGRLLPSRNPALAHTVQDQLQLLHSHMTSGTHFVGPLVGERPPRPDIGGGIPMGIEPGFPLSFDIETYGILRSMPDQHHFHPVKCARLDGVAPHNLIQTVAFTVKLLNGSYYTASYVWSNREHRKLIRKWFRWARDTGTPILGANITFDLSFLRHCDPRLRRETLNHKGIKLRDIFVLSYLDNEHRTEVNLKALASLFGVHKYEKTAASLFDSAEDLDLHFYNGADTWTTLVLYEKITQRIRDQYPETDKLSRYCLKWYSRVLWIVLHMTEAGYQVSPSGLRQEKDRCERLIEKLLRTNLEREESGPVQIVDKVDHQSRTVEISEYSGIQGGPFGGKGSKAYLEDLFEKLAEDLPYEHQGDIEYTDKTSKVSTSKRNQALMLEYLPHDHPSRPILRDLNTYRYTQKLVGSYYGPMLGFPSARDKAGTKTLHIGGRLYPSWFPVPMAQRDNTVGGTIQSRPTCKFPAAQTSPKEVQKTMVSRHCRGYLLSVDLSQIELRVAALVSGDKVMVGEYDRGIDSHEATGRLIFPDYNTVGEALRAKYRQAGKTINFLALYRGGAAVYRATLFNDVGISRSLEQCEADLLARRQKYWGLHLWQDQLIEETAETGLVPLPFIGQSRSFVGGPKSIPLSQAEIVNFPIQSVASNILLDIQWRLVKALDTMTTRMGLQVYDSVLLDVPHEEMGRVTEIIRYCFQKPPYYKKLCDHYSRHVPLAYDIEIKHAPHKGITQEMLENMYETA